MAAPNPLETQTYELKRLNLQREDPKGPMGLTVEVKIPGSVVVKNIGPDSVASKSGLQVGDIILFANDRTIFVRSDLVEAFANSGTDTPIVVARQRATRLGQPPLPSGKERKPDCDYLLFRLRKSAESDLKVEWTVDDGIVAAKEVTVGAMGHTSGLRTGDRVLAIGDEAVRDASHLTELAAAAKGGPIDVLIERPQPKPAEPRAPDSPFELELDPVTEPWQVQLVADPSVGVEPPPDDVQTMVDQCREALIEKVKPIKRAQVKSTKRVQIMNNVAVKPLKKEPKEWM